MTTRLKIGDIVEVAENRYGFKETECSHFNNPLRGSVIALYDRFCVVQLHHCCVAPFYCNVTKVTLK